MIRTPLGIRLDTVRPIRDQIREAARLGAKGVVLDAIGELAPDRLSETGRREIRYLLRSVELTLTGLTLPTRRPFDTIDQLEDRLRRAESAFTLAYELGTNLVLARVGAIPPESEPARRETWFASVTELGRRADHRGVRFAIETGTEPGSALRVALETINSIGLAASVDPASLLRLGHDAVQTVRELGHWVAHAYANSSLLATQAGFITAPGLGAALRALDWEEYLGALEEVHYHGFLTVWPDQARDVGAQFTAVSERLSRL